MADARLEALVARPDGGPHAAQAPEVTGPSEPPAGRAACRGFRAEAAEGTEPDSRGAPPPGTSANRLWGSRRGARASSRELPQGPKTQEVAGPRSGCVSRTPGAL